VSFLKAESVNLAVTLRDGYELRPGQPLKVQAAKFEKRDDVDGGGSRRLGKEEMQARKKQKLLERKALSEWGAGEATSGIRNATVVITGLFDAAAIAAADADADGGAAFYTNLREDVQVESGKAGAVEKVTVFEGSEQGAVAVRFKTPEEAERCAAMLDERTFGQSVVRCEVYDGVTDYRAPHKRQPPPAAGSAAANTAAATAQSDDTDEQVRSIDAFGDWLEADSTDEEIDPDAEDG